jgi:hypothetical protein
VRRQRRFAAARGIAHDTRGYVRALDDNLLLPLAPAVIEELGRGSELLPSPTRPPRLHSLCSSAALVLNVFAHWQGRDATPLLAALGLGGSSSALRLTFEEPLPTGLAGDPPTTDVALRWPSGALVAIESKFGEWLVRRPRTKYALKDKYFPLGVGVWEGAGLPRCQALAEELQTGRVRFKWLHVAQLLKHALGLARGGATDPTLLYLYYELSGREAPVHRAELTSVCERLAGEVDLRVRTYQELHEGLQATAGVDAAYLGYLRERYFA